MIKKSKKLIIWDLDGVIADTESIWMESRQKLLNQKFGINWTIYETYQYIGGMSWKTRLQTLNNMGICVDESFEKEAIELDYKLLKDGINLTLGIENIFSRKDIKQCIATGGTYERTQKKLEALKITNIFPKNRVFVSDMVKNGKPEPDLFLLAAKQMKELPDDCIIIEDSIAGLTAAIKAKIDVVAYIGSNINNNK